MHLLIQLADYHMNRLKLGAANGSVDFILAHQRCRAQNFAVNPPRQQGYPALQRAEPAANLRYRLRIS